jgi:hypothetical protein
LQKHVYFSQIILLIVWAPNILMVREIERPVRGGPIKLLDQQNLD